MISDRLSIFDDTGDVDLSGFQPKQGAETAGPDPGQVRAVSEAAAFKSREAQAPAAAPALKRPPRRHKTGRTAQLNVRIRPEFFEQAYAIADAQGWLVGETIERALEALNREIGKARHGS